jgi:3-methyladenine DNA glycosylase AlkD
MSASSNRGTPSPARRRSPAGPERRALPAETRASGRRVSGAGALSAVRRDIRKIARPARADSNKWFFKTGPGEYGEGDRFLGVTLPQIRALTREYRDMPLTQVVTLLRSPWHEERLLALLILVEQYARGDARTRRTIHQMYLRNTGSINNWDLVDASAAHIVGAHLETRDRRVLRRLARSKSVWERRIAMIATYHYIRQRDFTDALAIAALLRRDQHDLIHKAVGWMLREIGKRDRAAEERFLRAHARRMPRTMLRYAIENFPPPLRRRYMAR